MRKKQIFILGGGISGLSLAYYILPIKNLFEITLLEKEPQLGGWIDTDCSTGYFFEKGPHVFRGSSSAALLSLIHDLQMDQEILIPSNQNRSRYLWKNGKMKKFPYWSCGLILGLLKEWMVSPLYQSDESVWDFACRRFNTRVAQDFFDPLVTGISAGDSRLVSANLLLPQFKAWEHQKGSILKGLLHRNHFKGPSLFGFKRGIKSLIQKLVESLPIQFHMQEEILSIQWKKPIFEIKTMRSYYEADYIFSALPHSVIGRLLFPQLLNIPQKGVTLVHIGYQDHILTKKGYGYLVAGQQFAQDQEILGTVFNSNLFPEHNHLKEETRLTVFLKDTHLSDEQARNLALKGLKDHLNIDQLPTISLVSKAAGAFPQLLVNHEKRISQWEEKIQITHPNCYLLGNYFQGIGVNDCISRSKRVADNFLRQFPN